MFQTIPHDRITPSSLNPRREFQAEELKELAVSLAQDGILQPLVVRPCADDAFEIIAGERRWRAAEIAGLDTVPAIVRTDLDDVAVRRLMLVENIQRSSLRPVEEADACQALLDDDESMDVDGLADLLGRSTSWIYQRLQLRRLTPACRESIDRGRLSAGHAVEIARLAPSDQDRALAECDFHGQEDVPAWKSPAGVRELKRWIRRHIPLDRRDPTRCLGVPVVLETHLIQAAGLQPGDCRHIVRPGAIRVMDPDDKPCEHAEDAFVWLGEDAGKRIRICRQRRPPCEVHWKAHFEGLERQRKENAKWERERKQGHAAQKARDDARDRFKRDVVPRIEQAIEHTPFSDETAAEAVRSAQDGGHQPSLPPFDAANWWPALLRLAVRPGAWDIEGIAERAVKVLGMDPADVCTADEGGE